MLTYNKKDMRSLYQDLFSGKDPLDLTIYIKGNPNSKESDRGEFPASFERRKMPSFDEQKLSIPGKRMVMATSRSPDDVWTIIYKNRIAARGHFGELQKTLSETPKEIILTPHHGARSLLIASGVALAVGALFVGGLVAGGFMQSVKPSDDQSELNRKLTKYSGEISAIQSTLKSVLERQEVIKTFLVSSALPAAGLQAAGGGQASAGTETSFETRVRRQTEEMEIRQIADLEQRKADLVLRDQELDQLGYTPLHEHRRAVLSSIAVINQRISQLKNKYREGSGLPPA